LFVGFVEAFLLWLSLVELQQKEKGMNLNELRTNDKKEEQ
jgi:hypothetical protein